MLNVDGTAWRGSTDSADVATASQRYFGAPASPALLRNWTAAGAFPLAIAPGTSAFADGTIRVQFKLVGGASDQNAGILFALTPAGEYLYVRYNTKDGDLALWRYANAERTLIAHGTGTSKLSLGQWYELVLTVRAPRIDVAVTGVPSLTLTHTLDAIPAGRVGVWVKRDAVTSFRSFQVSRR